MPARKYREGADLEEWQARKNEHLLRMEIARERVKGLSGHVLLRLDEAAGMLGCTKKTLREMELANRDNPLFPRRVTLSPKVTGFRLMDLEAYMVSGMAPAPELAEA